MQSDNVCPNPTGSGPIGTAITRKKRMHCTRGLESCPHYSGRGGFECVDTQTDAESCGGCVSPDGKGSGTDCTAIEGVSVARCAKGSCVIDACRKGYAKSLDGSSCTPVGSKSERSSPAKRAIRGRAY
ncbi:hypothetical protein FS837_010035 [Tulasnella sp. UAMH 9824]|nr:hypothetical protein FS837_010035 [Tulasnella sp. UAMH 9824]